jgi:hypothetical protein
MGAILGVITKANVAALNVSPTIYPSKGPSFPKAFFQIYAL